MPPAAAKPAGRPGPVITVGSFDFPESVLLAEIYGQALAANKFPVRILPDLGPREVVDPALVDGLLQPVPEYARSALEFFSLGRLAATSNAGATNRTLVKSAAARGLVAARPAPAQDANAIVVTAATAARNGLRSIADLAPVAPAGAPPPLPHRVTITTTAWLVLTAVILTAAFVASQHTPWLRIEDRASTWLLRQLAGIRTPWLTEVAGAIKAAGTGWVTVLGASVIVLTMIFRRWRHLLVFMGSVLFLDIAGTLIYNSLSRPRPYGVPIITGWGGYSGGPPRWRSSRSS